MSFPSLSDRPLLALGGPQGAPQERQKPDTGYARLGASGERAESQDAQRSQADEGPLRRIVNLDLASLAEIEARKAMAPHSATVAEFLAAFSALLSSVSSGDVLSARDAANILQLELFGAQNAAEEETGADEDAPLRMLEDLVALIRFARLGDLNSAEAAAALLARHMQTALIAPPSPSKPAERLAGRRHAVRAASRREPPTLVQGATAAYELLMDPEPGLNAA